MERRLERSGRSTTQKQSQHSKATKNIAKSLPGKVDRKEGTKHDDGKLQWSLMPWEELEEMLRVIMMGAEKYAPNDWKKGAPFTEKYKDALVRHVTSYLKGENLDAESGLNHLAHAGVNCLFLLFFEKQNSENGECT